MITKIKWKNHDVLGSLELDFTKKDGTPYNTIVIAGENGTGKTTILDTLAYFLNSGPITPFDYIMYTVNTFKVKIFYDRDQNDYHKYGYHRRHNINTGEIVNINRNKDNGDKMMNDQFDLRSYGVAYSRARSGFQTKQVQSVRTNQLDKDKFNIDEEEDFTNIKQLLIDISSQDSNKLSNLAKSNNSVSSEEYEKHRKNSKMYRFENAFGNFFDDIKFDKIDDENQQEKRILFKKHDKTISIDSLSTGEKQIVFRGSYLLKNQKMINGGTVLIDEPELSMHPLWQEKVLKYYRDLFIVNNKQTVQMIVATHSEYVIKSALEDKDNALVISLKNNNGVISDNRVDTPQVLPTITLAETNYYTFNIVSIDYHIQLYGHLQNITECDTISKCDTYIKNYIKSKIKDKNKYLKSSSYTDRDGKTINYQTLSTYIRNAIDHPDNGNKYNENELRASIELLIEMIKDYNKSNGNTP